MKNIRFPISARPFTCLPWLMLAALWVGQVLASDNLQTQHYALTYDVLTDELEHPWSVAFLPDGGFLVTERPGRLRRLDSNGKLHPQPVAGLPRIQAQGQGGLLDVVLHPQYTHNRLVYFSYSEGEEGRIGTAVARGALRGQRLEDVEILFRLRPKSGSGYHFGSRLVFDRQGYLYITLGDRGERPRAQRLDDHAGSVIRLRDDGSIPVDNPFRDQPGARPEIYSYGHRNPQGAALHPLTGKLWIHEHGPQGGDEINLPIAGGNYGWPVITYGSNYGSGTSIGEGTHKAGMQQPLYYWDPSIAPSGMAFYTGKRFPRWRGNLLIGSLKFRLLVRLELDGEKVVHEERLLQDELGRIRDVRQGPDGYLYLLTDEDNGRLVRLRPLPAD